MHINDANVFESKNNKNDIYRSDKTHIGKSKDRWCEVKIDNVRPSTTHLLNRIENVYKLGFNVDA